MSERALLFLIVALTVPSLIHPAIRPILVCAVSDVASKDIEGFIATQFSIVIVALMLVPGPPTIPNRPPMLYPSPVALILLVL